MQHRACNVWEKGTLINQKNYVFNIWKYGNVL